LNGNLPESKTDIPEFLTPEKTLEILQVIFKQGCSAIQESLQALRDSGEVMPQNQKVKDILNSINMDAIKYQPSNRLPL